MIFWLACTCNPPEASLPRGTFDLSGGGAVGQLVVDEACRIALFGPSWDTGSPELRSCTDVGDGWCVVPAIKWCGGIVTVVAITVIAIDKRVRAASAWYIEIECFILLRITC